MKIIRTKNKRDRFMSYGKWWTIYRKFVDYERDDGSTTGWVEFTGKDKKPVQFIPIMPRSR